MHSVSMNETADHREARMLGEALAALRRARAMSQAEAAGRLGMTSQAWGLYEAGRRSGLFRPDVQRRMTQAIGCTPEDLALQVVRAGGRGSSQAPQTHLAERGRGFAGPGPSSSSRKTLQLSHDDLAPWAGSGVTLVYDEAVWPRPGQGCVIGLERGPVVGLYERGDAEAVHLRDMAGKVTRVARTDVRFLGAVVARLEGTEWPQ